MNKKLVIWIKYLIIGVFALGSVSIPISVQAKTIDESINGNIYEFGKSGNYAISPNSTYNPINKSGSNYGLFSIDGNMTRVDDVNGFAAYEVESGNVLLKYAINEEFFKESDTSRFIVNEKKKKLYGEKLGSKIGSGAIMLQTSQDGEKWYTDTSFVDIGAEGAFNGNLYWSKDIQQVNGCYYRVVVGYKTNQKNGKKNDYKKYVEVYQFYLINSSENAVNFADPDTEPKMNLGKKEEKKVNSGYSTTKTIGVNDPHYGWDIGQFYVNGYTRDMKDSETGNTIFLKNVGDRVTLWFKLNEDIDALRGDGNLLVINDKKGYNQKYQIEKTGMGRGTLIINFIGKDGANSDQRKPVIYTNYLEANARTGADTKVELFEEGDYEVVLDYKIKKKGFLFFYSTYDYQISFDFSVRNGNCMVFPFDLESGSELSDGAIAENGFYLDMAKSKYLDIDVKRTVLSDNLTEDVRFNRPAKDGDEYVDEGIYTFDVKNKYTGENTTKVIYVGNNKYLKALSKNNMTVEQLSKEIASGSTIGIDGTINKKTIVDDTIGSSVTVIKQGDSTPTTITEIVEREPTIVQVPVNSGPTYLFDINSVINSNYFYPGIAILAAIIIIPLFCIMRLTRRVGSLNKKMEKLLNQRNEKQ